MHWIGTGTLWAGGILDKLQATLRVGELMSTPW